MNDKYLSDSDSDSEGGRRRGLDGLVGCAKWGRGRTRLASIWLLSGCVGVLVLAQRPRRFASVRRCGEGEGDKVLLTALYLPARP